MDIVLKFIRKQKAARNCHLYTDVNYRVRLLNENGNNQAAGVTTISFLPEFQCAALCDANSGNLWAVHKCAETMANA